MINNKKKNLKAFDVKNTTTPSATRTDLTPSSFDVTARTEATKRNQASLELERKRSQGDFTDFKLNPEVLKPQSPKQNNNVAGRYDASRGGYVAEDGRFYPTSNPNFVPQNTFSETKFNKDGSVTLRKGGVEETLSREEYKTLMGGGGIITEKMQNISNALTPQEIEAQMLSSQVGQMGELGNLTATPLDYSQALKQGLASAVPKAASFASAGLAAGALGGAKVGGAVGTTGGAIGIGAGAAIGAALGAVSGIVSGMQSNIKSQKVDNVNAQKRVLDEGKQDLNDLVRLMEKYPERRTDILKTYNAKATQIRRAYAQIKINTQNDLFEYESAIPDLAEFDAFFSFGGEFDNLNTEMQLAITQGSLNPDVQIQEIFSKYGY